MSFGGPRGGARSRTNQRLPSEEVFFLSKSHPATLDAHSNPKPSLDGETLMR